MDACAGVWLARLATIFMVQKALACANTALQVLLRCSRTGCTLRCSKALRLVFAQARAFSRLDGVSGLLFCPWPAE